MTHPSGSSREARRKMGCLFMGSDSSKRRELKAGSRPAVGRRGFTLVELLVAMVVSTILMGAIYQVLVTNQRISAVQREQVLSQQTVRAGLDLLAQELREVSAGGGDLVTIDPQSVEFRALRAFGVACSVSAPTITLAFHGRPFQAGDDVYLFADGNPDSGADDEWLAGSVQSVTNMTSCGTDDAQQVSMSGLSGAEWARVRPGAILRSWELLEYGIQSISGESHLVRVQDGVAARMVGPLDPGTGLLFEYLDVAGDVTTVPTQVTRVRIELRTISDARSEQGSQVADSLSTAVFLRN